MGKDKISISLKKAKTLLEKTIKMHEEGKYCVDIIQQNLAAIGLIKASNLLMLEGHLNHCFVNAVKSGDKDNLNKMIEEIISIVKIAQNK